MIHHEEHEGEKMYPDWSKRMVNIYDEKIPSSDWMRIMFLRYWTITDRWYGY